MIPDYQTFMLPFLKLLADEKEHSRKDVQDNLAKSMNISDTDKEQLNKSDIGEINLDKICVSNNKKLVYIYNKKLSK